MCGIFSVIAKSSEVKTEIAHKLLTDVARLSEVRGVDSSGLCYIDDMSRCYLVTKGPVKISGLFKRTGLNKKVQPISNGIFFS
ncbi:MAG: hypothetical protein L6Q66_10720, partial [Bacteroidia bacterium]|nr:hypothetical protein [Bacteroidia bacterium]